MKPFKILCFLILAFAFSPFASSEEINAEVAKKYSTECYTEEFDTQLSRSVSYCRKICSQAVSTDKDLLASCAKSYRYAMQLLRASSKQESNDASTFSDVTVKVNYKPESSKPYKIIVYEVIDADNSQIKSQCKTITADLEWLAIRGEYAASEAAALSNVENVSGTVNISSKIHLEKQPDGKTLCLVKGRLGLAKDESKQRDLIIHTTIKKSNYSKFVESKVYKSASANQIEEAQTIYDLCVGTLRIKQKKHCECYATKFLQNRVENGPDRQKEAILIDLKNSCLNIVTQTEAEYYSCMPQNGYGGFTEAQKDPIFHKKYCECYAHNWASLIGEKNNEVSIKKQTSLRRTARAQCRDSLSRI